MGWQEDRGQDSRHGHTSVPHLFGTAKNLSLAPKDFIFSPLISKLNKASIRHFTQMLVTCISSLFYVVVVVVVDYDDFGEKH